MLIHQHKYTRFIVVTVVVLKKKNLKFDKGFWTCHHTGTNAIGQDSIALFAKTLL